MGLTVVAGQTDTRSEEFSTSLAIASTDPAVLNVANNSPWDIDSLDVKYGYNNWQVECKGLIIVPAGRVGYIGCYVTQAAVTVGTPKAIGPGIKMASTIVTAAQIKAAGLADGACGIIGTGFYRDAGVNFTAYKFSCNIGPLDNSVQEIDKVVT